jgi:hypothetical protein
MTVSAFDRLALSGAMGDATKRVVERLLAAKREIETDQAPCAGQQGAPSASSITRHYDE